MSEPVIIFGGIGTLIETSDIQRQAFNDAFHALDIDFTWQPDAYRASLLSTGGQKRLSMVRLNDGTTLSATQVAAVHAQKTAHYVARLTNSRLDLRPGVAELISYYQRQAGILAWATTTSSANIDGIIAASGNRLSRDMFAFIGNDKVVAHQKPHPEIYQLCLKSLGLSPSQALAIEDSLTGVQSAKAAGVRTIAFPGAVNGNWDVSLADEVVDTLTSLIQTCDV